MKLNEPHRTRYGGTLVEGIVAIILTVGTLVVSGYFLADVFLLMLYKLKLSTVTNRAASYLARRCHTWNFRFDASILDDRLQKDGTKYVKELLIHNGLPDASSVVVKSANQTIRITVNLSQVPLLPIPGILPTQASISDTAAAIAINNQPPALLTVSHALNPATLVTIPVSLIRSKKESLQHNSTPGLRQN